MPMIETKYLRATGARPARIRARCLGYVLTVDLDPRDDTPAEAMRQHLQAARAIAARHCSTPGLTWYLAEVAPGRAWFVADATAIAFENDRRGT